METPFWAVVAKRKVGGGDGWEWCSSEAVGRDFLIKGGVPTIVTRGKAKGRKRWKGVPLDRALVSRDEFDAEAARYEAETGNCRECRGAGKTAYRWSKDEGTSYRECRSCGGTGKAP